MKKLKISKYSKTGGARANMSSGIYPRTLEQNKKISKTLSGRILPEWHKEKIRNTLLG